MIRAVPLLLFLAVEIFCVIDVIQSREEEVRKLPKTAWILLVLLFPLIGIVAWFAVGRPRSASGRRSPYERSMPHYPEYDRPGRAAGVSTESDENFLRQVRERAEEQRRRYAEQQRAAAEQEPETETESGP